MKYLLLVTVFVGGHPPQSYQALFNSAEACEFARNAIYAEMKRVKAEQAREGGEDGQMLAMQKGVSAVCAPQ